MKFELQSSCCAWGKSLTTTPWQDVQAGGAHLPGLGQRQGLQGGGGGARRLGHHAALRPQEEVGVLPGVRRPGCVDLFLAPRTRRLCLTACFACPQRGRRGWTRRAVASCCPGSAPPRWPSPTTCTARAPPGRTTTCTGPRATTTPGRPCARSAQVGLACPSLPASKMAAKQERNPVSSLQTTRTSRTRGSAPPTA